MLATHCRRAQLVSIPDRAVTCPPRARRYSFPVQARVTSVAGMDTHSIGCGDVPPSGSAPGVVSGGNEPRGQGHGGLDRVGCVRSGKGTDGANSIAFRDIIGDTRDGGSPGDHRTPHPALCLRLLDCGQGTGGQGNGSALSENVPLRARCAAHHGAAGAVIPRHKVSSPAGFDRQKRPHHGPRW